MKKILNIKQIKARTLPLFAAAFFSLTAVNAQDGESIFKANCSACHSIGNGKFVGPDLKDVGQRRKEDWLLKFIKGSQAFIKENAEAKALYDQFNITMPDQKLSDGEVKAVLSYISVKSAPAEAAPVATTDTAPAKVEEVVVVDKAKGATREQIELGKSLFEGSVRFANGGASCLSCHNVNYDGLLKGGVLAKDLSTCYSRLGGDAGVMGILGAPPFPAMTAAFKDKPLTEEEIFALTAFLYKADKVQATQHENSGGPLLMGGLTVMATILTLILLIWVSRKRHCVKDDIYKRQTRTI